MFEQEFQGTKSSKNNKQTKPSRTWKGETFEWNRHFKITGSPEYIKAFWIFSRSKKILFGNGVV